MLPVIDQFGRVHRNLRISVTDRCNIRCFYCMPAGKFQFLPARDLLSFEEIEEFVRAVVPMGIDRVRLTGGEPLVRKELWKLIKLLHGIDGLNEIALTTNGILLTEQANQLYRAGLDRLNISLDTIDPRKFEEMTRRDELGRVLAGIDAAQAAGFTRIRINAVSIAGTTETEIVPLAQFCRNRDLELRFIEFMPLDADNHWETDQVLNGDRVRQIIETEIGPLEPATRTYLAQPAIDYRYADGNGTVGFIDPVSQPFCDTCDRLRITAEGKIRNCLFSTIEWDVRELIRQQATQEEIRSLVRECVAAKKAAHGIDSDEFVRPHRSMYQIGG